MSGLAWFLIGLLIFFLSVIGIAIFFGVKYNNYKKVKIPANSPIITFQDKRISQGHFAAVDMGIVRQDSEVEVHLIKPLDLSYNKKNKPMKKDPFEVHIRRDLIGESPAGGNGLSDYRNIKLVAAAKEVKMDKNLVSNTLGKFHLDYQKLKNQGDELSKENRQKERLLFVEKAELPVFENDKAKFFKDLSKMVIKYAENQGKQD